MGANHKNLPSSRSRGTDINPPNRFEKLHYEPDPEAEEESYHTCKTCFYKDDTVSIISRNISPDIPYEISLNPYRGCEHGCAYCYARPTHEYLGWSSGLDFETKILVKTNAPTLLRNELLKPNWSPKPITLSGVTDPYQPAERYFQITRKCLEVLAEFKHPVCIVTKNATILRDIDLLQELARYNAVLVEITLTSLAPELSSKLEPRTSRPAYRLQAIQKLSEAGIPVGVLVAPVIPGLNDHEIPSILEQSAKAGARWASMSLLRLPYAVKNIFLDWLYKHFPLRAEKVINLIRRTRNGKLNDSRFFTRFTGEGPEARRLFKWFEICLRHAGFKSPPPCLSAEAFLSKHSKQLYLF